MIVYQMTVALLLGLVAYYGIIQSNSLHTKYLVGFGFIIPVALAIPFPFIEHFDIRAVSLRLCLISAPLTCTLKTLEAIYGFTPEFATISIQEFLTHFGFILYPKRDHKTKQRIPMTRASFWNCMRTLLIHALQNGVLYSMFITCAFQPLRPSRPDTDVYVAIDANQLLNTLLAATMLSLSLAFSMNGVASIVQLVGGFQTELVVNDPIFGSTSPSDFWGNRWNMLIHRGLKQGVYKPVRMATGSRNLATMLTFLASGVAHEYVWAVTFHQNSHEPGKYIPRFGKSLLFFCWNGILLIVEHWVQRRRWDVALESMPRWLVSLSVVMFALPVGHLFTGDFRHGGYFESLVTTWPMVTVIQI